MNIRFGVTNKLVALAAVVSIAMMLGACSKPNEAIAKAPSVATDAARPIKFAKAYVYDGGMCTIDSSNPQAVSNLIIASRKLPLGIYGWAVTDSTGRPLPPMVFAVLRGDRGTFYLEGKRVPRPDVATKLGNQFFGMAGFEVSGDLSNIPVGEYKLSVATGTEFVVAFCVTKLVVRINE